jgi:acetyl-CoA acyltransferase 2
LHPSTISATLFDSSFSRILTGIFIVGARRTAFGTFGGSFKNITATQLQTAAAQAALKDAGLSPEKVDSVVIGHVMQSTQR